MDEYSLSYVEGRERLFPLAILVFVLALSGKAWFECVVRSSCDRTELELGWASKMRGWKLSSLSIGVSSFVFVYCLLLILVFLLF